MSNETINEILLAELKLLNENIKDLTEVLKSSSKSKLIKPKVVKTPPKQLTKEELEKYQIEFSTLYDLWLNDKQQELQDLLNKLSPDETRLLADANNLNVTTRMAKEKVLKLIEMRFREKKMLTSNTIITKPNKDNKPIS